MIEDYTVQTPEQRSLMGRMMRFCMTNKLVVSLLVIFIVGADSLWDSSDVGPIPDGGIWGSSNVVVSPSAVWNYSFPIGSQPCE